MAGTGNDDGPDEASGRTADVPGWHNRVPSGQRGGVDEAEAERLAKRTPAEQRVDRQDRQIRKFSGTQFIAHVTDRVKYNRNGDMLIELQVPYQFKHLADPLTDAFGIPLSIDVQIWKPFAEASGE